LRTASELYISLAPLINLLVIGVIDLNISDDTAHIPAKSFEL